MVDVIGDTVMPKDLIIPLMTDTEYSNGPTATTVSGSVKVSGGTLYLASGSAWWEITPDGTKV